MSSDKLSTKGVNGLNIRFSNMLPILLLILVLLVFTWYVDRQMSIVLSEVQITKNQIDGKATSILNKNVEMLETINKLKSPIMSPPMPMTPQQMPPPTPKAQQQMPPPSSMPPQQMPPPTPKAQQQMPPPSSMPPQQMPPPSSMPPQQMPPPTSKAQQQMPPPTSKAQQQMPPPTQDSNSNFQLPGVNLDKHIREGSNNDVEDNIEDNIEEITPTVVNNPRTIEMILASS